jgi:hypothetical protein
MPLVRNSVGTWLGIVALIALCLAPLANLSDLTSLALVYLKFGLVILATFLARYRPGRPAAWWFGFATLGWASILIGGPGNSMPQFSLSGRISFSDLCDSLGCSVLDVLIPDWRPASRRLPYGINGPFFHIRGVVQFWFLIVAATAGGLLSLFVYDRQNRQRLDVEPAQALGSANSL